MKNIAKLVAVFSLVFLTGCSAASAEPHTPADSPTVLDGKSEGLTGFYTFTEKDGYAYLLTTVLIPNGYSISNREYDFSTLIEDGDIVFIEAPEAYLELSIENPENKARLDSVESVDVSSGTLDNIRNKAEAITLICQNSSLDTVKVSLTYVSEEGIINSGN